LLLHEPTLLLLDEPTNFLDLRTQILLEHFLRGFRQACLIVSHDRAFLNATCTHTLDISLGKLTMYPGKIDGYLEYEKERREHDIRVNATVVAKQKQLKRFIDKNRAGANTASQARSKQKQLDRLQTTEIAAHEAIAHIRAPVVEPRQGTAVRCRGLDIGYVLENGERLSIANQIDLEIEHGSRTAIVGDNGQGKTTLLRSLVGSLDTLAGEVRWGHHCDIGTYAQHVYSSLPEKQTVLYYLEYKAMAGTTNQHILALAGALLFRDEHVKKKIGVLSGGERARLCLAGLLLSTNNILVLDEPGNHLDVETAEALAQALLIFKGTVIFTAHDRYFMQRVATSVIEVRDGRARNYIGDYDGYVYAMNKEIDEGERLLNSKNSAGPTHRSIGEKSGSKESKRSPQKDHRKLRKEIGNLERKIARFDEESRDLNAALLNETDAGQALKLHEQNVEVKKQLAEAEERWLEFQEQIGEADW
jgi:ATP-binding cassette subfamily F protein 3